MIKVILGVVFLLSDILSTVPLANAQSTFSWNFTCEGSKFQQETGFVSIAATTWNWTVNGVAENAGSGRANCNESANQTNTVSGSGAVPANANGIVAFVRAQTAGGHGCSASTSQSFSSTGTVNIKNLSCSAHGVESGLSTFIEATFNLRS